MNWLWKIYRKYDDLKEPRRFIYFLMTFVGILLMPVVFTLISGYYHAALELPVIGLLLFAGVTRAHWLKHSKSLMRP